MIVQLKCCCHWPQQKQKRISELVADRAKILLGKNVARKVNNMIFVDNVDLTFEQDSLFPPSLRKNILLNKSEENTYTLFVNSTVLFAMLKPGPGQAYFDEIISLAKVVICELETPKSP